MRCEVLVLLALLAPACADDGSTAPASFSLVGVDGSITGRAVGNIGDGVVCTVSFNVDGRARFGGAP